MTAANRALMASAPSLQEVAGLRGAGRRRAVKQALFRYHFRELTNVSNRERDA